MQSLYLVRRFFSVLSSQGPTAAYHRFMRWVKGKRRYYNLTILDPAHPWITQETDLTTVTDNPDQAQFNAIGQEFLGYFKTLCGLKPDDKVLDVGCGIGRIAFPLTTYLSPAGHYEGFDIIKSQIEWCQTHISSQHPNFHFKHLNVYNKTYNPQGIETSTTVRFPYEDEQFDLVFLTSVFTHMLAADVDHYLSEIARVLRKGKPCFFTIFLLNDESKRLIKEQPLKARYDFPVRYGDYAVMDAKRPEDAISFEEHYIRQLCEKHGLQIQAPIYYGAWSGREQHLSGQDCVIAIKV